MGAERAGVFRGRYHVLGGSLSAIEGYGPQDLGIDRLIEWGATGQVREVILATTPRSMVRPRPTILLIASSGPGPQ